jgi:hypothetical protein
MSGTINIHLTDPGKLVFKAKARCRVLIDGEEVGTTHIGDTASFTVPRGEHELRIAMDVGFITRKTRWLRVLVADNETVQVTGTYSRIWGKYSISVSS